MIEVNNVSKEYNEEESFFANKDINLKFDKGMYAIVGKSGAGKSTLLNIIGGLLKPTNGTVLIDSEDIYSYNDSRLSKYRNENIGYVFQSFYLEEGYTVYKNVELPLLIKGEKKRQEAIDNALKRFGVLEKKNTRVNKLSGGEKQRVALSRAIICNPKILLCDEPTGNLDETNSRIVMDYLREIADTGVLVILITHDLEGAKKADKIYEIVDGKIINSAISTI